MICIVRCVWVQIVYPYVTYLHLLYCSQQPILYPEFVKTLAVANLVLDYVQYVWMKS